jgi:oxaloacetate decarboxylase beta subunit
MKNWNLLKHTLFSALAAALFNYLWGFITIHEAASIGIIGGADGPTSIFISGNELIPYNLSIIKLLLSVAAPGIIAFVVMMLCYKPVRNLVINKHRSRQNRNK